MKSKKISVLSFITLLLLLFVTYRSKAQYSSLEDFREEVNLNQKPQTKNNPKKTIEINVVDLPESDADKNKIQKGYDNLVAAVKSKNGSEVTKVLEKLDIITSQKVLNRFIQNYKTLQAESLLESDKTAAPKEQIEEKSEQSQSSE
jgi:hypothetical protein